MGLYTEQISDILFDWDYFDDYDEDYSALIEKLNNNDVFRTFGDGLLFFFQKRNPELTAETAIKYIEELCENTGVLKSDIASVNTLKSWFKGGPQPKKGEESRKSMFALAFALKLTPTETAELFHKVYLDRAFDYRNINEIIYYYCLNNSKSWQDANRLITSAQINSVDVTDSTIYTAQIKTDIEAIVNDSMLLSYIAKHGYNLEKKNVSAKQVVQDLLLKSKEYVKKDAAKTIKKIDGKEIYIYKDEYKNSNPDSMSFLYEVIICQSVSGEKGTITLFKNSRLPKEIKNRFPEAFTLTKKDPTYEELRKLIILLASYNFWYKMQDENKIIELDVYIDEINVYLNESGFSLMYYGNPYDWLFLYCTLSNRPLDTFRGLLAEVLEEE